MFKEATILGTTPAIAPGYSPVDYSSLLGFLGELHAKLHYLFNDR